LAWILYIGDIMENYEVHRDLFHLPQYAFPICLLCFGYPTQQQKDRPQTTRYAKEYVVHEDRYRRLSETEFADMYRQEEARTSLARELPEGVANFGQWMYARKFNADFSREMSRSVRAMIKGWLAE
jgi:FMN reductase (NADPH)/FMN reductase [NAD(P)H]